MSIGKSSILGRLNYEVQINIIREQYKSDYFTSPIMADVRFFCEDENMKKQVLL